MRGLVRIVVAGRLAAAPGQGGATWAVLQYVHGFTRLGHDVLLLEPAPRDDRVLAYFAAVTGRHGLVGRAAVLHPDGTATGLWRREVEHWVAGADVLINLAGVLTDGALIDAVSVRVYVDLDPAFTQLWHVVDGVDMNFAGHDRFVTAGLAVGGPNCTVPTCGRDWVTTLPPVVLALWPVVGGPTAWDLTTVGNWRSYGSVQYEGVHHGQKAHSVRGLLDMPRLVSGVRVEPAIDIDPGERDDLDALARHGWTLHRPTEVAGDPERYQAFVQASRAEIGLTKSGYVVSRCGWFSDRSVCYLASGRPVIAQDTGWTQFLPHGEGLVAFTDAAEAATGVAEIVADYERHRKAARDLAEEWFDSDRVLSVLLDRVTAS